MRICKVPADSTKDVEYTDIENTLAGLRAAIGGGYIERVSTGVTIHHLPKHLMLVMVVDEEGRLKGLPLNERAMLHYPGIIVGDVCFCAEGRDADGEIDFTSLPEGYMVPLWMK